MEQLRSFIFNSSLTDAEKVALAMIGISGERTTQELTNDLGKCSQHVTSMMRKLEKTGLVNGFRRGVAGRRGADKVYSLAMPTD